MTLNIRSSIWHWYSLDQATAAITFKNKARELETKPPAPNANEQKRGLRWAESAHREHRSYALASITSSASFLEASINELYASAADDRLAVGGGLTLGERETLSEVADMLSSVRLLDRFQITLRLLGRQSFTKGAQPYQDADLLIALRNGLVHYKPRWHSGDNDAVGDESTIGQKLRHKKFPIHPFTSAKNAYFPDRCLGHACALWAWQSAVAFTDAFFRSLGVIPVYENLRNEIGL